MHLSVTSIALLLLYVSSVSVSAFRATLRRNGGVLYKNTIIVPSQRLITVVRGVDVFSEFGEEEAEEKVVTKKDDKDDTRTDEEKGRTHGYEGGFKVGDVVKVSKPIRIWSIKKYASEGFICEGYEGVVKSLELYGRKQKSLCSAITPVKVEFSPDGNGVPPGMFERKWLAHFAAGELELVAKAPQ